MKRIGACVALSTALLSGCATSYHPSRAAEASPIEEVFSARAKDIAETTFNDARNYWSARHIGGIASVRLVLLEHNKTFVCPDIFGKPDKLTSLSIYQYCLSRNTVIATAIMANATTYYGGTAAVQAFNISHEMGHAVQASREPEVLQHRSNPAVLQEIELQATYYAGEYMANRYDIPALQQVAAFICKVPPDGYHGSSAQQADAFIHGVEASHPEDQLVTC